MAATTTSLPRWCSCCLDSVGRLPDLRRSDSSAAQHQRGMTIHEIVSTERAYVADLELLTQTYKPALARAIADASERADFRGTTRAGPDAALLSALFHPSLEPLLALHCELLSALEAAVAEHELHTVGDNLASARAVGRALGTIVPYLRLYAGYCANHPQAVQAAASARGQPEAAAALRGVERRERPLESLLIKPVQRLCKYPLLLSATLKLLPPSRPEHAEVRAALRAVEQLNREVNAKVHEAAQASELLELVQQMGGVAKLGTPLAGELLAPTCHLLVQHDVLLSFNLAEHPPPPDSWQPPHRPHRLAVLTSGVLLGKFETSSLVGRAARRSNRPCTAPRPRPDFPRELPRQARSAPL